MQVQSPPALSAQVGIAVRKHRQARGLSQDELASRLQKLGLAWQRSAVAELERGGRGLSLDETAFLCSVLDVTLHDLLQGKGSVLLGKTRNPWSLPMLRLHLLREPLDSASELHAAVAERLRAGQQAEREAEQKAARRLGMPATEVAHLSQKLWGRGLTEERDHRVAQSLIDDEDVQPARLQAMRGHVTRQLMHELRGEQ